MYCGKEKGAKFDPKHSHNALDLLPFPSHTSSFWRTTIYLMDATSPYFILCIVETPAFYPKLLENMHESKQDSIEMLACM